MFLRCLTAISRKFILQKRKCVGEIPEQYRMSGDSFPLFLRSSRSHSEIDEDSISTCIHSLGTPWTSIKQRWTSSTNQNNFSYDLLRSRITSDVETVQFSLLERNMGLHHNSGEEKICIIVQATVFGKTNSSVYHLNGIFGSYFWTNGTALFSTKETKSIL